MKLMSVKNSGTSWQGTSIQKRLSKRGTETELDKQETVPKNIFQMVFFHHPNLENTFSKLSETKQDKQKNMKNEEKKRARNFHPDHYAFHQREKRVSPVWYHFFQVICQHLASNVHPETHRQKTTRNVHNISNHQFASFQWTDKFTEISV